MGSYPPKDLSSLACTIISANGLLLGKYCVQGIYRIHNHGEH